MYVRCFFFFGFFADVLHFRPDEVLFLREGVFLLCNFAFFFFPARSDQYDEHETECSMWRIPPLGGAPRLGDVSPFKYLAPPIQPFVRFPIGLDF